MAHSDKETVGLALLGFGKMGKAIAQLAPQRGCEVKLTLEIDDNEKGLGITREKFAGIDVAIDFTMPDAVVENVRHAADAGVNLVVGTTGWYDRLDEVRGIVEKGGIGMVYGANFSIGVQLFYRAARAVAAEFADFPMYVPYITEAHHATKKDAPSGTAKELKRIIEASLKGRDIPLSSIRGGFIPGTHELGFDSEGDTIILRHTARGRQGFAEGALLAAKWVAGKRGLFTFAEVLKG